LVQKKITTTTKKTQRKSMCTGRNPNCGYPRVQATCFTTEL